MIKNKNIILDNEYTIMSEIVANERVTQRELSRKLGVSVSTVNMLINKMCREGLIKMTQVSQKQVLYILTPEGMIEKAKKTVNYLKIHYRVIFETKEKIKRTLNELAKTYESVYVLLSDSELSEIMNIAIDEYKSTDKNMKIIVIKSQESTNLEHKMQSVLIHMSVDEEELKYYIHNFDCDVINLLEVI